MIQPDGSPSPPPGSIPPEPVRTSTRSTSGAQSVMGAIPKRRSRSEEHTSELQSQSNLVCRLLLEKKKPSKIAYQCDIPTREARNQRGWRYSSRRTKKYDHGGNEAADHPPQERVVLTTYKLVLIRV